MTSPRKARDKQLAALGTLGQIDTDVPNERMTVPTPDLAVLLTWHSEVAEDNSYNERVREIHRLTVEALDALVAVTAERDQARSYLDGAEGQLRIRSDEAYEQRVRATRAESLLDQARQMLADAPHDAICPIRLPETMRIPEDKCCCWKAGL